MDEDAASASAISMMKQASAGGNDDSVQFNERDHGDDEINKGT
jgi:hypothetical protein